MRARDVYAILFYHKLKVKPSIFIKSSNHYICDSDFKFCVLWSGGCWVSWHVCWFAHIWNALSNVRSRKHVHIIVESGARVCAYFQMQMLIWICWNCVLCKMLMMVRRRDEMLSLQRIRSGNFHLSHCVRRMKSTFLISNWMKLNWSQTETSRITNRFHI